MLNNELMAKYIRPLSPIPTNLKPGGKLKKKIRCLLFDIYGTLFISGTGDIGIAKKESQQKKNLKELLLKFGLDISPGKILDNLFRAIEKTHDSLKKEGVDFPEVVIEHIWMRILRNDDVELAKAFAAEFELIFNPVYPMPNLQKMLSVYKDLNLPMGVVSNAQFYTPFLFNRFLNADMEDLGFHPDLIFFSYKFGYAKPSTFLFREAIERLKSSDIRADSVLYIGNDMLNDIYPAKTVGFSTALFAGDTRSLRLREGNPSCKNISADIVITDLIQLLDHVQ